ncbi:hypothetical protein GCM10010387_15930 [Streptomyces inusitatus]|uniref:Uncharacterized protein n=1 Tax=Streptomyces inusitatus TaxID=68221 RepID=A0A918PWK0_9ACTN|nr:hypothetical protein [Streptomyces inusitatus]GGZ23546.1 hypothetical protein GCM10010387_15930 [Streptomyces inusitatus]
MNARSKAAHRALLLAGITLGRADGHPESRALRLTARALDQAASVLNGRTGDQDITGRARAILHQARTAAPIEFPCEVIGYVSAPLVGHLPGVGDLMPANPLHAVRERELRARLLAILSSGLLDSSDGQEVTAALVALLDLHTDHHHLAGEVADHGRADAHPTVYRPSTGTRTAQHLPGRLTVFDGGLILVELPVPFGITPGEIWQTIRTAQPATTLAAA